MEKYTVRLTSNAVGVVLSESRVDLGDAVVIIGQYASGERVQVPGIVKEILEIEKLEDYLKKMFRLKSS